MENLRLNNDDFFRLVLDKLFLTYPYLEINPNPIGHGGMKTVYQALDKNLKRNLVIKVIKFTRDDGEKRTKREIDILKLLSSRYFPVILDTQIIKIGQQEIFIILESFVTGKTLREFNKSGLAFEEAVIIGKELLEALALVHQKKLVHRDVKPENIMITENGELVLLDFGIARDLTDDSITSELAIFGPMTIGYAAPEQVANKKKLISERTDLFSWAVVLYELLTSANPIVQGEISKERILQKTLKFSPDSVDFNNIPEDLKYVIKKNLSPAVHKRSGSALEILDFLKRKGY